MTHRVVLTLLARDELDIVASMIDYHLGEGVSRIIVTDNGSTDGTLDILREYERRDLIDLLIESGVDFSQHERVTRMARLAHERYGADWVINADADEFFAWRDGRLVEAFEIVPRACDRLLASRHDFVPFDRPGDRTPPLEMIYRKAVSRNQVGKPLPPKAIHRGDGAVVVSPGNHHAKAPSFRAKPVPAPIEVFHYPIRTYAQFESKVRNWGFAHAINELPPAADDHRARRYELLRRGELELEYRERLFFDDQRLQSALSSGELVEDRTIADRLEGPSLGSVHAESMTADGRDVTGGRALLVVGMHRSGTSAVARSLSFLGAALPRTPLPPGKGEEVHWGESAPIEALHEELLASAGTSWDDPSPFPTSWYDSPAGRHFLARLVEVISEEYARAELFLVKDPRLCRIVPLWVTALEELGVAPAFVIPVRNPLEVAASLAQRDEFPRAKGILLWLRHVLDAERDTRGHRRAFVAYEDMLREPERATRALCDRLELDAAGPGTTEVEGFLSAGERHHRFTADELAARQDVADWAKEAYALLLEASRAGEDPDPEPLDRLGGALTNAHLSYGAALDGLELTIRELREKVKARNEAYAMLEDHHRRTVNDHKRTVTELRHARDEAHRALSRARRNESRNQRVWARAAREIERSRTWRVGNFLIRALRLLTFRRPAPSQGPGELATRIESGDRGDESSKEVRQASAAEQVSE